MSKSVVTQGAASLPTGVLTKMMFEEGGSRDRLWKVGKRGWNENHKHGECQNYNGKERLSICV